MNKLVVIILVLLNTISNAQDNKPWVAFTDSITEYTGFKDENGVIRIEPRIVGFSRAHKFEDIMAVLEDDNGTFIGYYLTKSGKKVGYDSLFTYDNGSDCESEGFIRFADPETGLEGMFDKNGNIAIPATYNALSQVNNGLIVALKGAKKSFWDKYLGAGCNYFTWKGGDQYLIDTNNQILINNFDSFSTLDFYSLSTGPFPSDDTLRVNFKGVNGMYYSFRDFRKAFNVVIDSFLNNTFLIKDFESMCYDSIYYWDSNNGWVAAPSVHFLEKNFELITSTLLQPIKEASDYRIYVNGLNPYIFAHESFDRYFNNCNEAKESKYPVMNIVFSRDTTGDFIQDSFEFLLTDNGFKLISTSIGSGNIK
jgi:hypothetical protein